jgi:hypothetical protein
MKDTAYIFKMADKNKTKVIKWLKDRQNELLRAPLPELQVSGSGDENGGRRKTPQTRPPRAST